MVRNRWTAWAVALTLLVLGGGGGCGGGSDGFIPVEGKVTVAGQPLAQGVVIFLPNPDKGNASMHEPRGEIKADGAYKLITGANSQGAPPGWYRVSVYAGVKVNPNDPYSPEKSAINGKYADKMQSGLEVEVKPGLPPGSYDFKLTK